MLLQDITNHIKFKFQNFKKKKKSNYLILSKFTFNITNFKQGNFKRYFSKEKGALYTVKYKN